MRFRFENSVFSKNTFRLTLVVAALVSSGANAQPWTVVVIPDTQFYSETIFQSVMQWIVDERVSRNIRLVLTEGDITNDNDPAQWQRAKDAFSLLDGEIPYILTVGNADYGATGGGDSRDTNLNSYFSLTDNPLNNSPSGIIMTEFLAGELQNTYSTFTAPDGRKLLIFSLEFGPRQQVVEWANDVATQFPNNSAVLMTHAYLEEGPAVNGEPTPLRSNWELYGESRNHNPHVYGMADINPETDPVHDGEELWNELVSQHNFELVLNGHYLDDSDTDPNGPLTTARQSSIGVGGNIVHEIVFNAQQQSANGFVRILEFSGNTVQVRTYSPSLDVWLADSRNEFQFELSNVETVCAGSGILEGFGERNDFNATCGSDDLYWAAHGTSLFYQLADPVVQFELTATAPAGFGGNSISIAIEASKEDNNGNLNLLAFLFNYATVSYESLPSVMPLTTADVIQTFGLPAGADPNDFIEPGTNDIKLLIQTIQKSGLPNVRTQLDEVLFHFH